MSSPVGSTATSGRDAGICYWVCSASCRRCWRSRSWRPWTMGDIHWSHVPWWGCLLGYALLHHRDRGPDLGKAVNKFFEPLVRIQTDRGHKVIDTGPYAIVRHPGYAFGFLFFLGMPLALGSLWALIPAILCARSWSCGRSGRIGRFRQSCPATRNMPSGSGTGWFLGSGRNSEVQRSLEVWWAYPGALEPHDRPYQDSTHPPTS